MTEHNYTIELLQPAITPVPDGPQNYHAVLLTHGRESVTAHYERALYPVDGEPAGRPADHPRRGAGHRRLREPAALGVGRLRAPLPRSGPRPGRPGGTGPAAADLHRERLHQRGRPAGRVPHADARADAGLRGGRAGARPGGCSASPSCATGWPRHRRAAVPGLGRRPGPPARARAAADQPHLGAVPARRPVRGAAARRPRAAGAAVPELPPGLHRQPGRRPVRRPRSTPGCSGRPASSGRASTWRLPSGRVFYSPGEGDDPGRRAATTPGGTSSGRTGSPTRSATPRRSATTGYDLLVRQTRDPLGNLVTAGERDPADELTTDGNDYRVLAPRLVSDPNRNRVGGRVRHARPGLRHRRDGQAGGAARRQPGRLRAGPAARGGRGVLRRPVRPADTNCSARPPRGCCTTRTPTGAAGANGPPGWPSWPARRMSATWRPDSGRRSSAGSATPTASAGRSSTRARPPPGRSPRTARTSRTAGSAAAGRCSTTRASRSGSTSRSSPPRRGSSSPAPRGSARCSSTTRPGGS